MAMPSIQETLDRLQKADVLLAEIENMRNRYDSKIVEAFEVGVKVSEIAKAAGIQRHTVYQILRRAQGSADRQEV